MPPLRDIERLDGLADDFWDTDSRDELAPTRSSRSRSRTASPVSSPKARSRASSVQSIDSVSTVRADEDFDGIELLNDFDEPSRDTASELQIELGTSTVVSPRSALCNYDPPLPVSRECDAVNALLRAAQQEKESRDDGSKAEEEEYIFDSYTQFMLDDFEVYFKTPKYGRRLRSLHFVAAEKKNHDTLYFDGVLSVGAARFYVQNVPFFEVPIDNYGSDYDTVGDRIWIRSRLNAKKVIYYRLRTPSLVYERFFRPFFWVADLGKHFVDFCKDMIDHGRNVRLSHFEINFARWLRRVHRQSTAVQAWHAKYGRDDFRKATVTYRNYLWKESSGILGKSCMRAQAWDKETRCELYTRQSPRPVDKDRPKDQNSLAAAVPPTVTTPYVYSLYAKQRIHPFLVEVPGKDMPSRLDNSTILPQGQMPFRTEPVSPDAQAAIRGIRPGDVISTAADDDGAPDELYYALVHRVCQTSKGSRKFEVAWLYRSIDTPCGETTIYPFANELFMSKHCTCEEDAATYPKITEDQVAGVHSIEWFGSPETTADFFVRQTYISTDSRLVQFRPEHVFCDASRDEAACCSVFPSHVDMSRDAPPTYAPHDTVLAQLEEGDTTTEPFEMAALFVEKNGPGQKPVSMARLRRFLRRHKVDPAAPNAAVNELVHTDQFVKLPTSRIQGRCYVRAFSTSDAIPVPYSRGGTGNFFYLTHKQQVSGTEQHVYVPLDGTEKLSFRQGFDPSVPVPDKLRALEVFCGCGNMGRGLADSGVVESHWLNDIWEPAIHTVMANIPSEGAAQPFLGSADDFLWRALRGHSSPEVPAPGEVDFILGGSPCQGFSALTLDKNTPQQFKNRSMVALFASLVHLYRPKMGLLENVLAILDKGKEDVFGQLVCCLVGLGYQTNIILGNAWSYGAPQLRQRVFLVFATPGVPLPATPLPSHASPPATFRHTVGWLRNGEYIAKTWDGPTAFPFVSAAAATADLQRGPGIINDGIVDICVRYPDHLVAQGMTTQVRSKIAHIPTFPRGMNLAKTLALDQELGCTSVATFLFSESQLKKARMGKSRHYQRTTASAQFYTVTTSSNVDDGRTGIVHWRDPRPLSVLEVRRAQGIPDHEVLIGEPKDQWKMVGNAVARQPALAIGLSIREAWLGSLYEDAAPPEALSQKATASQTTTTVTTTTTTTTTTTRTAAVCRPSTGLQLRENRIFKTSVCTIISGSEEVVESRPSSQQSSLSATQAHHTSPQTKRPCPPTLEINITPKKARQDEPEWIVIDDD